MITTDLVAQFPSAADTKKHSNTASSPAFSELLNTQTKALKEGEEKDPVRIAEVKKEQERAAQAVKQREELQQLVSMTPAQLIRFQMLEEMGLTEESLKELPFEERMKIEGMIKEAIEQKVGSENEITDTVMSLL